MKRYLLLFYMIIAIAISIYAMVCLGMGWGLPITRGINLATGLICFCLFVMKYTEYINNQRYNNRQYKIIKINKFSKKPVEDCSKGHTWRTVRNGLNKDRYRTCMTCGIWDAWNDDRVKYEPALPPYE